MKLEIRNRCSDFTGYRAAREQTATAEFLLSDFQKRRDSTRAMLEAGEIDPLTMASVEAEFSAAALARLNSVAKAQQALAALEDAVQSPLLLPRSDRFWEQNPRLSRTETEQ